MSRLYIQYQTNSAVPIDTTYGRGLQGTLPLDIIYDLIAAYKTAVAPLLDHSSLAQLTLHLPNGIPRSALTEDCFSPTDSTGTTLRNSLALTRLNGFEFDDIQPLIIKSKNDTVQGIDRNEMVVEIASHDFLQYVPPKIEFSLTNTKERESKSSGPRAHPKEPATVLSWYDFLPNAELFRLESSCLISPPTFTNYEANVSDEDILHGRIEANILNPINHLLKALGYNLLFTGHSEILKPVLKGWPDHVLHENHELMSFIETKTIWDLPTPLNNETINQWWNEDISALISQSTRQNPRPSILHVIGQVYGYLSNHELTYGMLTNGEVVWFLCTPNLQNAPTTLLISQPVSLVGESPTLFQSIMYFVSLVIDNHKSGKSPETSPTDTLIPLSVRGRDIQGVPADLDLSQLNEKVGDGFCGNVFKYISCDGTEIAVKCCDKNNNKEGYRMMKKEVKIYRKLESLQGTVVPTLRFSGFVGETFLIGTDYIKGKHLIQGTKKSEVVIKKLKQKLAQHKIEHGDLREKNILEDESGNHWVFDFGKSEIIDSQ
ncbi:hypothetical protein HDV02_002644 [Globomyces sp. JEL0801]|nr:hypothetical protein HDV02_002644 [Globomyces sp. JEL0801]